MGPYRRSLNVISVREPCDERWERMEGDARSRFCRACESHVYDLSQMTLAEASELIELTNGTACVRLYRRADGTVVTKDECRPDRVRARRRRWLRRSAWMAAAGIAVGAAIAGTALTSGPRPGLIMAPDTSIHEERIMGGMVIHPERVDPVWVHPGSIYDDRPAPQWE